MRFNDLLRTVLANMGEGTGAMVTRWRQCIDLLAQYDVSGARAADAQGRLEREAILDLLAEMRPHVAVEQRVATIAELGGRLRSPGLVRLFSQDHPSLVAEMMRHARLTDADWASIIPDLGPLARSVLRRREDMGPLALGALRQFGSVDLTLPSLVPDAAEQALAEPDAREAEPLPDEPDEGETGTGHGEMPSQIGRLVARIERFTEARAHRPVDERPSFETPPAARADEPPAPAPVDAFTFETDGSGLIRLVSGAPRGAAYGLSIAMPALDSRQGADGTALGAFRRRAAFDNARFTIGEGLLQGEWRISADPRFDRMSGRFLGYAGSARREYPHESIVRASAGAEPPGWQGLSAESARQLIHELRTPLNAIHGYAEMIEAQLVGPVTAEYQDIARQILADARALIATFDDLDMVSRIERGDDPAMRERVELEPLVADLLRSFGHAGDGRVDLAVSGQLPPVAGHRAQVERMLSHLIRAGSAALGGDERLSIRLAADAAGATASVAMRRPELLRGMSDQELLDHGYLVDQKLRDAPPLGLAFTLKLVRGIAHHLGGRFEILPDAFRLVLPTAAADGGEQERRR